MKIMNGVRSRLIVACLTGGFALCASANLLTNGSFDDQSVVTNKPVGWVTTLDGSYWGGYTANMAATNVVYKYNSVAAGDGDYYVRRVMFASTAPGTWSFASVNYNLSALGLPGDTTGLVLSLKTTATGATADIGKLETYGSIVFYSGLNGTGSVVGTYDTDRVVSETVTVWHDVSVTAAIPVDALSCAVFGRIEVNSTLSSAFYGARFDGFDVTAVPEPATMSIFLFSGIGLLAVRRRLKS